MNQWRKFINQNATAVTLVSVVATMAALAWMLRPPQDEQAASEGPRLAYFYDLGTDQIFTAPVNPLPPIDAPSGRNQGVLAYVFGCGNCAPENRHVAYLEMYTPEAQAQLRSREPALASGNAEMVEISIEGRLYRVPDQDKWIDANSPQAVAVQESLAAIADLCNSKQQRLITCFPEAK